MARQGSSASWFYLFCVALLVALGCDSGGRSSRSAAAGASGRVASAGSEPGASSNSAANAGADAFDGGSNSSGGASGASTSDAGGIGDGASGFSGNAGPDSTGGDVGTGGTGGDVGTGGTSGRAGAPATGGSGGTNECAPGCSWPTPACVAGACGNATLTITRNGAGSGTVSYPDGVECGATCSRSFSTTPVILTATAEAGSTFAGWSGGGCAGTRTCVVDLTGGDVAVTATFTHGQNVVTVVADGNGTGTITSDPAGIDCGTTCSASFASDDGLVLTATPAPGSIFVGWSGGACIGSGTCTVAGSGSWFVTAIFTTDSMLCASAATDMLCPNDTIPEVDLGPMSATACQKQCETTLLAAGTPRGCWTLAGGNCLCRSGPLISSEGDTGGACSIEQRALTVSLSGDGTGTVTSSLEGIDCGTTCVGVYPSTARVALTVTPAAGSVFAGWSGSDCGGTGVCSVSMLTATNVTARFVVGSVQCESLSNVYGCSEGSLDAIDLGPLTDTACHDQCQTAMAGAGMTTGCWALVPGGSCYCRSGSVTTTTTSSVSGGGCALAQTLTVGKVGNGTGTVTSNPAGISCGSTCAAPFFVDTNVELTATPAAGTRFTGWSGAGCTGTGTCTVSVTAATAVSATFATGPLSCATVTNALICSNGSVPQIELGALDWTECHDQCEIAMDAAGMTTGCWVASDDGNCYCRSGELTPGSAYVLGGSCL